MNLSTNRCSKTIEISNSTERSPTTMQCFTIQASQWMSSFKCHVVLAATLVCCLSLAIPAEAGLLIDIAPNTVLPGTSSTLEVTLTNTGTDPLDSLLVAGFSFEITAAGTNVTFSDVTTGTSLHSLFSGPIRLSAPTLCWLSALTDMPSSLLTFIPSRPQERP